MISHHVAACVCNFGFLACTVLRLASLQEKTVYRFQASLALSLSLSLLLSYFHIRIYVEGVFGHMSIWVCTTLCGACMSTEQGGFRYRRACGSLLKPWHSKSGSPIASNSCSAPMLERLSPESLPGPKSMYNHGPVGFFQRCLAMIAQPSRHL